MKKRSGCAGTLAPLMRASTLCTNWRIVRLSSMDANGWKYFSNLGLVDQPSKVMPHL